MSDPSTTLAPRLSLEQLVKNFEQASRDIREGFAMVERAEELLNRTFVMEGTGWIRARNRHERVHFGDPEGSLTEVRRQVWGHLIEALELRKIMSVKAWDDLQKQIRDDAEVPEITHESVTSMATGFRSQMPQMLEAAIEEVFDWLRPPRSEYKRNSEFEVPRRIVISYAVERWGNVYDTWRVSYHRDPNFNALERVFRALDGKGQTTERSYSRISELVRATPRTSAKCEGETKYFSFRAFKNGNLHLTFLREDLLARFNQIAGGKRLRGAA
jgi:hypothetical protein